MNLISKWNEITDREDRSIKEAMNFLYQHNLIHKVFPPNVFRQHHGDLFIHHGYQQFNWAEAIKRFYLPQIERIETALRLKEELHNNKTTTRTKI